MTTNYDPIAEQYKRAKQQPWRAHIEAFTLMQLIGDPTGKAVIDIACGEGFYTRMIRQRGAAKVTGVDLSEKMIGLARVSEAQQRLGIDYIVGDGRDLGLAAEYDLAVAAYFLNYAHDRAELNAMCGGIARCLKPGGQFVTVNSNPACGFPAAPSYRKYGFEASVMGPFREGARITWTFHWRMALSISRTIFSMSRSMRRHFTPPDFATSAGVSRCCRRRVMPATDAITGRPCWITRR
jgi:toxoflavin synthase